MSTPRKSNDAPDLVAALEDSFKPVSIQWRCERCKASGTVSTRKAAGATRARRIREAHDDLSPYCDPIIRTGA